MLVKYSCDCIGFPPDDEGKAWLIRACDTDRHDYPYGIFTRDMSEKTYSELPPKVVEDHMRQLSKLVFNGYRLQNVQSLLGIKE